MFMALPDVQLHAVHALHRRPVDLAPPLEARRVEVGADGLLVADARGLDLRAPPALGVGERHHHRQRPLGR